MKANEFVKKFGLDTAKNVININNGFLYFEVIENTPCYSNHYYADCNQVLLKDLKRLVESHELVEACGGIDVVKRHLKEGNVFRFEEKPLMRQTIADVESYQ